MAKKAIPIDLFAIAEKIHLDFPSLRFTSGRWAIYDGVFGENCVLYDDFIECVKQLKKEPGLEYINLVVHDGNTARKLEEILRTECDDGEFHPWGLSWIAREAMERFKNGERLNKIPKTFISLNRQDCLFLLESVFHSNEIGKFWIISGRAGSGKSSLMNIAIQMLDDDYSAIENTKGTDYDLDQIVCSRIAYADDVTGDLPISSGFLKSIVTHGNISVDPKFKTKYTVKYPQCVIVFLSNEKPRINIGDTGVLRRICWYKKTNPIKNPDQKRLTQRYSEIELCDLGLFLLSLEEYLKSDAVPFNWFDYFKEDTIEMASASSSVYRFYSSLSKMERCKFNYPNYRDWCKDSGYKAYNLGNFDDQTQTLIDWGRIKGDEIGEID